MNKRYRASPKRGEVGQAILNIERALKDLDAMRQGLEDASYNLWLAVDNAPNIISQDFRMFWMAGGCTEARYREWTDGHRSDHSVPKRRHLRLVSNQKKHCSLARRQPAGPDDGPAAA